MVRESYITSIAAGIRVQSDLDSRSISVARVLHQMARYPQAVTRTRYLQDRGATKKGSGLWQWANDGFDQLAGPGQERMDPAVPSADLERLLTATDPIRRIVNSTIAHANKKTRRLKGSLRPKDLIVPLDLLAELADKYSGHLANSSASTHWTLPAWWTIFRDGWETPTDLLGQLI
jgi:hypothetical protein